MQPFPSNSPSRLKWFVTGAVVFAITLASLIILVFEIAFRH